MNFVALQQHYGHLLSIVAGCEAAGFAIDTTEDESRQRYHRACESKLGEGVVCPCKGC